MSETNGIPIDRRSLALRLAAAAAGTALLPALPVRAESTAAAPAPEEAMEPHVEAALASTPAPLTPEQRLDVRNNVRGLHKALAEARAIELPYDTEPAFIFLPGGGR